MRGASGQASLVLMVALISLHLGILQQPLQPAIVDHRMVTARASDKAHAPATEETDVGGVVSLS